MFFKRNKKRKDFFLVEPDEIFLDSYNLENFDQQQFEGRIEKQISKKTILFLGSVCFLIFIVFSFRLGFLQIKKGEAYLNWSLNNTLRKEIIFADRGIIYDRNKIELAWNEKSLDENNLINQIPLRKYKNPGFSHVLGFVSYPSVDSKGFFWQTDFIGKDGLEKVYDKELKGINGTKIVERNARGLIQSENIINLPKKNEGIISTLDSRIQAKLFELIRNHAENYSFLGGAGILMNVNNGEIITLTNYPEYNSEILSLGQNKEIINQYLNDPRKVFLNKSISGLYTPGSIVKPFFALGALEEKIISPKKKIFSSGSISIPNPYFPDQPTIFKDWKAHGWTDIIEAIAVSSDVYFYAIGGGFENQKGLGISNLEKYSKLFNIGQKTLIDLPNEKEGNIPNPEWKKNNFKGDIWRIGDTFHTSIGQYGFQVTPLEMARSVAALANYGKLIQPHLILNDLNKKKNFTKIEVQNENLNIINQGMRETVLNGTATVLNVPFVEIAAKTGTAQLGVLKNRVNSWIVGFFPYQEPKYVFVILMESGPAGNTPGASWVMRNLIDWMFINTPEYLN